MKAYKILDLAQLNLSALVIGDMIFTCDSNNNKGLQ